MTEIPHSLTYPGIIAAGVPFDAAARISDAIQSILAPPSREDDGKTVRVRIAVAVDANGSWTANGWLDAPDQRRHRLIRQRSQA